MEGERMLQHLEALALGPAALRVGAAIGLGHGLVKGGARDAVAGAESILQQERGAPVGVLGRRE